MMTFFIAYTPSPKAIENYGCDFFDIHKFISMKANPSLTIFVIHEK